MRNDNNALAGSISGSAQQIGQVFPASDPGTLDCASRQVTGARQRIESAIDRVRALADRIYGPQPAPLNKQEGVTSTKPCAAIELDQSLTCLLGRAEELHVQIERLERL